MTCHTVARVADHQLIDPVAVQAGTSILQHALVSGLGIVSGSGGMGDGLCQPDGIFRLLGESSVTLLVVNLRINSFFPVLVGHVAIAGIDVAVDEVLAPTVPHHVPFVGLVGVMVGVLGCSDANLCNACGYTFTTLHGAGTRLVVVVDDVHVLTFTAIAAVAAPVVEHVVADIYTFIGLRAYTRT